MIRVCVLTQHYLFCIHIKINLMIAESSYPSPRSSTTLRTPQMAHTSMTWLSFINFIYFHSKCLFLCGNYSKVCYCITMSWKMKKKYEQNWRYFVGFFFRLVFKMSKNFVLAMKCSKLVHIPDFLLRSCLRYKWSLADLVNCPLVL